MAKVIRKSAVSGRFVSKGEAAANPKETYTAKVRAKCKGWVCLNEKGKIIPDSLSNDKGLTRTYGKDGCKAVRVTCIVEG